VTTVAAAPVSAMPQPAMRVPCPLCGHDRAAFERTVGGYRLDRCGSCAFVFMNPQYSSAQIAELYVDRDVDSLSGIYQRIAAAPSVVAEYTARLERFEAVLPARGRLLDFACGAGAFFEIAQRRGWDAHGTELGRWAKEAAEARGLRNMHVGELRDLAFPDGYFDVVHAAQVFEHLPSPPAELGELRRILRPGGLLYIDVPNYRTLSIVLGRDDFMLNEPPQHLNYFSPATLTALIEGAGFSCVRTYTSGGLKWENLIGRSIRSDIKDAYGLGSPKSKAEATAPKAPVSNGRAPAAGSPLKRLALASIVKPLLYDRLKVGMKLSAIARR
jgi:SAM-dependent methyltransferase